MSTYRIELRFLVEIDAEDEEEARYEAYDLAKISSEKLGGVPFSYALKGTIDALIDE